MPRNDYSFVSRLTRAERIEAASGSELSSLSSQRTYSETVKRAAIIGATTVISVIPEFFNFRLEERAAGSIADHINRYWMRKRRPAFLAASKQQEQHLRPLRVVARLR
jgi:hypothetical protein